MLRNILEKLIYLFVFSLLIFSPLPIGSVKPWARFALQLQAFLLFFLWLLWSINDEEVFKIRIKKPLTTFVISAYMPISNHSTPTIYSRGFIRKEPGNMGKEQVVTLKHWIRR